MNNIILVVIDPFVRCHTVNENSNNEIDLVLQQLSALAITTQCAISMVHHTRKLSGGSQDESMDISRGASALVSAARIVSTILPATEKDALTLGTSRPQDLADYVKLIKIKGNMSPGYEPPIWFKKKSVTLPNGETVGVLRENSLDIDPVEIQSIDEILVDTIGHYYGTGPISYATVNTYIMQNFPTKHKGIDPGIHYGKNYKLFCTTQGIVIEERDNVT